MSNMDPSIYAKRKRVNFIGMLLSMTAMAVGLSFLLWILSILLMKGFSALDVSMFL
ncbi:MAG: Phosphate transport system permease protein PstA, partial [Pseudomonadota bacterium]